MYKKKKKNRLQAGDKFILVDYRTTGVFCDWKTSELSGREEARGGESDPRER